VFDKLSARLSAVVEGLRGRGGSPRRTSATPCGKCAWRLLEADVALPVVKEFVEAVKARAIGLEIHKSLTPGQALVRVIHEELVRVMGEGVRPITCARSRRVHPTRRPAGRGKTTTAAKIALWLRSASASACCSSRPTCAVRLRCCSSSALVAQLGIDVAAASPSETPLAIARARSKRRVAVSTTALLVDTAAACTSDEEMMAEVRELGASLKRSRRCSSSTAWRARTQ